MVDGSGNGGARKGDSRDAKRGGVASVQSVLGQYLRQSGLERKFSTTRIYKAWRDALGATLGARARPVRFEDGTLEVAVRSAAHLQELSTFTGESYRKAANRKLGGERILRVEFRLER